MASCVLQISARNANRLQCTLREGAAAARVQGTEEQAVFQRGTPYRLSPPWKVRRQSWGSFPQEAFRTISGINEPIELPALELRHSPAERAGAPGRGPLLEQGASPPDARL